eukprot:Nk52_evm11s2657 gene=Nk52_evmTU11s2657
MQQETNSQIVRVGTRKSKLALMQTNIIVDKLQASHQSYKFEIVTMETIGDKILDVALSKIGEKSLFTKELEVALEAGAVDMIVHSLKDLPTHLPDNMAIGLMNKRDSPYDCVLFHPKHRNTVKCIGDLPEGSVIGTSSLRRIAQLKLKFKNLDFKDIRGNIHTRISKLEDKNDYDAIILAEAGLQRMGMSNRIDEVLNDMYYAVSQGCIAVEHKENDAFIETLLKPLKHEQSLYACSAERAYMRFLEGGCSVPLGVKSEFCEGSLLRLNGLVANLEGTDSVTASEEAIVQSVEEAEALGHALGKQMMALGAKKILDAIPRSA